MLVSAEFVDGVVQQRLPLSYTAVCSCQEPCVCSQLWEITVIVQCREGSCVLPHINQINVSHIDLRCLFDIQSSYERT